MAWVPAGALSASSMASETPKACVEERRLRTGRDAALQPSTLDRVHVGVAQCEEDEVLIEVGARQRRGQGHGLDRELAGALEPLDHRRDVVGPLGPRRNVPPSCTSIQPAGRSSALRTSS